MSAGRIATRYAKSLIDLAVEEKKIDQILKDVESFRDLIKESPDFRTFIKSPVIQASKKVSILKELFAKKYDDLTVKFLAILAQKQREPLLPEIAEAFVEQYRTMNKISTAVVTVAKELSAENKKMIKQQLEKSGISFDTVELEVKKDPSLIGGFVLEFNNYVYDASVSHQLDLLGKQFKGNLYDRQ